jgi:hypothetical protein
MLSLATSTLWRLRATKVTTRLLGLVSLTSPCKSTSTSSEKSKKRLRLLEEFPQKQKPLPTHPQAPSSWAKVAVIVYPKRDLSP